VVKSTNVLTVECIYYDHIIMIIILILIMTIIINMNIIL